jgi:Zn-finger nucleic acid-binding protein
MSETKTVCQHCSHETNGYVRICPVCGGEIIRDVSGIEAKCPRCACSLVKFDYSGQNIEKCPQCSGLWVHTKEFESLTRERNIYLDSAVPSEFIKKPVPETEGYLPCACCSKRMCRANFRHISGIIIDFCGECGCWLDAGELESIRAFIASGGIDKSQDKELSTIKTDVESLEGRVGQLEFMQKILNRWKLKRIIFDGF